MYYEVATLKYNSDPDILKKFNTMEAALIEFDAQAADLHDRIKSYLSSRDRRESPSDRTVELAQIVVELGEDGEELDLTETVIKAYGSAEDWDSVREELGGD